MRISSLVTAPDLSPYTETAIAAGSVLSSTSRASFKPPHLQLIHPILILLPFSFFLLFFLAFLALSYFLFFQLSTFLFRESRTEESAAARVDWME
jgi:hypothetical protein